MQLTPEQIKLINSECPYGQGVFREPFGIPDNIKGHVIYTKWRSGGRGGSCWDDGNTVNEDYYSFRPSDAFIVLDKVLAILKPDITFSEYKEIEGLLDSNTKTDYGYYGDYTEDTIEWIELTNLYEVLGYGNIS
jgi:hypothetical protein